MHLYYFVLKYARLSFFGSVVKEVRKTGLIKHNLNVGVLKVSIGVQVFQESSKVVYDSVIVILRNHSMIVNALKLHRTMCLAAKFSQTILAVNCNLDQLTNQNIMISCDTRVCAEAHCPRRRATETNYKHNM